MKFTPQDVERERRYLRMRKTDPLYRLTSSPLTYLIGGIFFTGATGLTAMLANSEPDATKQSIDSIIPYFFGTVAGLNYLMSGVYAWSWSVARRIIRESEKKGDHHPAIKEK
jgi:hypothetical protein